MGIRALVFIISVLALTQFSQAEKKFDLKVLETIQNYKPPSNFCKNPTKKQICDVLKDAKGVALKYKDRVNQFVLVGLAAKRNGEKFNESKNRKFARDFKKFKNQFLSDVKKIERERLLLPRTNIENANILELIQQIIQKLFTIPQKIARILFGDSEIDLSSTSTWIPSYESTTTRKPVIRPVESEPAPEDVDADEWPSSDSDSTSEELYK